MTFCAPVLIWIPIGFLTVFLFLVGRFRSVDDARIVFRDLWRQYKTQALWIIGAISLLQIVLTVVQSLSGGGCR